MEARRRTTLRDVAAWANVSVMTVSNVVNGKTARVSDDVRLRVQEAVDALKYRPQLRGRSLRLARDFTIGLVVLHPERRFLNDPFNTEVAAGMGNRLAKDGYGLMIFGAKNLADLKKELGRISQLDAIAVYAYGDRTQRRACYDMLAELGLPMMLVGDEMLGPTPIPDASFVRQENEEGAASLARLVIERGARSILFVRPDHVWPAMTQRERGVRRVAEGRALVETLMVSELEFRSIVKELVTRLSRGPGIDAVMGGNDLFGIAALHAARELGLTVPRDLIVTGFNGFSFREFSEPLLTSVRSRAYDIGTVAAESLVDRIVSGSFPDGGTILPVEFLPGATA